MTVRRRVVLLSLLAILILAVATVLLLPIFAGPDYFGPQHLKEFLLSRIERNLGRTVEVGTMQLHVFPKLKIELVDLTIRDADPSLVFLKAKRAEVVLRLLPLFLGQVVAKRLRVEEPTLVLRRNREGQWNFLTMGPSGEALAESVGYPLGRLLLLRELTIQNGELAVIDEFWTDGIRSVRVQALDATVQAQARQRQAELYISGILVGSTGTSSLTLAGTLTPTPLQVQIAQETAEGIIPAFQFEGAAEATNFPLRELAHFIGPRPIPKEVKGAVNLHGHIRLVPGVVGYDMTLTDLTAKVKHLAFDGRATVSGLLTAQPTFALNFSSSQVQLKELFDIMSARWIHTELPELIDKWDIRGTLEVVTATLTGVVTPEPRLSLTGEFRVHEGHAVVDKSGTVADNVFSTVLVEPDRIRAIEISGMYGAMRVDAGKAKVSFLEAGPWLELELKGEMAAADLLEQVDIGHLLQSEEVAQAWKGWHDVQGVSLLGFRISGPLNRPQEIAYVGAEFEALDMSFGTSLLPGRVTGLNGRLVIVEKEITLDSLRGFLEQTQFELNGRITGDQKNAYHDFVITTRGKAEDLVQFFTLAIPSNLPPLGTVETVVGLSGPLATPKFKGRVDLDDTAWTFPGLGRKPRGRQAAIEFDGGFAKRAVPLLHRIEVVLPSLRVSGRGTIRIDKRFRINAAFGVGPIAVTLLPDWMKPKGLERGEVEISLDVSGKGRDWSTWQITGWLALTDGVVSFEGLESAVRGINLRLKLVPDRAELKHLTFRILDSEARLSGVIRKWQTKPSMTLAIQSSHFDLELLMPRRRDGPLKKFFTDLAASTRVSATAKLKRGTYKLLSLLDLSGRVTISDGVIDVDRITGKSLPGQVDGRMIIRLPRRQAGSVEAVWRAAGLPFQDFYSLISPTDSPVSGDLFFTGSLRGHHKAPRGVKSTLNGRTDLRIENGRFLKDDSRAIWKVLSALSLPALLRGQVDLEKDGFPFDEISAIMVVQDGRVSSDNIIVDSPVVKMTAAGSYDIPTDQLNYVVAVSPLGPYGSLLGRIPLFGKLIKGERKGLATALFDVKGSIHDPQVTYRPLKSFTSGLAGIAKLAVDVLVNIVTLPKEILAPSKDGEPQVDQVPQLPEPATP